MKAIWKVNFNDRLSTYMLVLEWLMESGNSLQQCFEQGTVLIDPKHCDRIDRVFRIHDMLEAQTKTALMMSISCKKWDPVCPRRKTNPGLVPDIFAEIFDLQNKSIR